MSEQELREQVAKNLAEYRKLNGMTQLELAERLNYSDKSVSKWERGDGMPDVYVLTQIADLFGIRVDDLLSDRPPHKSSLAFHILRRRSHLLITLLSVGLVWLIAILSFFFIKLFAPTLPMAWLAFVAALPVSCIVLVVFACLWGTPLLQSLAVSGLTWTIAVTIDVAVNYPNMFLIYTVAAAVQVLIVLWYFLRRNFRKKR